MSIARDDDRYNEDLVEEIAESFNAAMAGADEEHEGEHLDGEAGANDEHADEQAGEQAGPRFVITGDSRDPEDRPR